MTILLLACGAILLTLAAWGICRGTSRDDSHPPVVDKPKRVYERGMCPHCGELDVPLRQDGEPCARWHNCLLRGLPTASEAI